MLKLDDLLLAVSQKFCDTIQALTGLTKFRIEKWSMMISSILWIAGFFAYGITLGVVVFIVVMPSTTLCVLIIERWEVAFLTAGELHPPVGSTSARITTFWIYSFLFLLNVYSNNSGFISLGIVFWVGFWYIDACVPRPPAKSKAKQLWESGLWWLHDRLKPEPAMVPIPIDR